MSQRPPAPPRRIGALLWSLILLGGGVPLVHADEPTWYQVEVIVFARTANDDGVEKWPANIQLRYPFNWVELKDPDAPEDLPSEPHSDEEESAPEQTVDLTQQPFYQLPRTARKLNNHASSMDRQSAYRVLFHEAWRQPVLEQQQAPAILITGGREFGNHFELEGSIHLSVARYLHLHTRLWLTQFEPNFGQPPGAWPELPLRPNQQRHEAIENAPMEPWDSRWGGERSSAWDLSLNTRASQPDFLGEEYIPSRIATLTQQRRMRSRELHYIDHPLFGILIEITPYEREGQDD